MKNGRGWLRGKYLASALGGQQSGDSGGGRGWGILIWSEPICSILESSQADRAPSPWLPQF